MGTTPTRNGSGTCRAIQRPSSCPSTTAPSSSRQVTENASLDDLSVKEVGNEPGQHFNLRWILTHLLEEYARHAGHADLLREQIDGSVGD